MPIDLVEERTRSPMEKKPNMPIVDGLVLGLRQDELESLDLGRGFIRRLTNSVSEAILEAESLGSQTDLVLHFSPVHGLVRIKGGYLLGMSGELLSCGEETTGVAGKLGPPTRIVGSYWSGVVSYEVQNICVELNSSSGRIVSIGMFYQNLPLR